MSAKDKIVVIVGPTASGKSSLAIKLAKKFNGEIISADSRQIYRGMDVGTAKPKVQGTLRILNFSAGGGSASGGQFPNSKIKKSKASISNPIIAGGIPHYLIDIKNPDEEYTVARYKKDCLKAIRGVLKKKKTPILVGGTGLYVKAVTNNLQIPEVPPDKNFRKKLELRIRNEGLNALYDELVRLDPEAAYIVDKHNPARVVRALEISIKTNRPFSEQRKKGPKLFDALKIGFNLPEDKLKSRIFKRADAMTNDGLIAEVKKLLRKYSADLPAFDAIGYREIIDYLKGKYPLKSAIELIKTNTWYYAKRQMTWFKTDHEIHWINPHTQKGLGGAIKLCKKFLEKSKSI